MIIDSDAQLSMPDQAQIEALRDRIAALEQQLAQSTMLAQEARTLQGILDAIPIPVFYKNLQDVYLDCNTAFAQYLACARADIIGKTSDDLAPRALAQIYQQADCDLVEQQAAQVYESSVLHADGSPHDILFHKAPLRNADGTVVGLVGVMLDITERKRDETTLRESEERLRAISEATPVAITISRVSDGMIVYANKRAREVFDGVQEGYTGRKAADTYADPAEREAMLAALRQHGRLRDYEIRFKKADGTLFWMAVSMDPLVLRGEPTILSALYDLTERKRYEEERAQLQAAIIHAQEVALAELSTPLIPLSDEVMVMPLVGTMDSRRAQQVLETLLSGIAQHKAQIAILDITGVTVVDTAVANALVRAAQAVQLLGARVILTGIRPEVAQTLVGLGVNLQGIITLSTLQSAITYAIARS